MSCGILSQIISQELHNKTILQREEIKPYQTRSNLCSVTSLPTSFGAYALRIAVYILNVVPSKYIPKTLLQLWNKMKLGLMSNSCVEKKNEKLEPHSELCIFVGYPNGTKGGLLYSHQDKKVLGSTNATFLEHNYMKIFKSKSKIVLKNCFQNIIIYLH